MVNRAMPFYIENKKNEPIRNYTHAWAQKYGWMWQIPTQKRLGCGYVYNDSYITPEQAQKEIEARRSTQLQTAQEPFGRLGFLSDIYAGAPTAQQTSQQTIAPSTSPLLQAAGLGIAGLGAFGTAKQAGLF